MTVVVKEHVLPACKTEAEAESSDTAKEVAEVGVDTTTSDNTDIDVSKEVTVHTDGWVETEALGNAMKENTVRSIGSGADHALSGVSIYLVLTSDTLPKNSYLAENQRRRDLRNEWGRKVRKNHIGIKK